MKHLVLLGMIIIGIVVASVTITYIQSTGEPLPFTCEPGGVYTTKECP